MMNNISNRSFSDILNDMETLNGIALYVLDYIQQKMQSDYLTQDCIMTALKEAVKREKEVI